MAGGGFSPKRLARLRALLERQVDSGFVPGMVAVLARHGEVHTEAIGNLAFEGAGARTPMAGDTICRMASMTKPVVAACAMTLVEDGTLRLDDPTVEELVEVYRLVGGKEHPDWDDYRRAMVADGRLVVRLHVERLYGWIM
jgi:CubicO group peptidase (beta-lactamase class C family)